MRFFSKINITIEIDSSCSIFCDYIVNSETVKSIFYVQILLLRLIKSNHYLCHAGIQKCIQS